MEREDNDPWRDAEWARRQVMRMLVRLLEQLRLGRELPADPWQDTLPEARRRDEK